MPAKSSHSILSIGTFSECRVLWNPQKNGTDSEKVVSLLESQVQDLKAQLDTATDEKAELLKLLSAEKEEKRALMPPADEKPQKSPNWLLRLVGAR